MEPMGWGLAQAFSLSSGFVGFTRFIRFRAKGFSFIVTTHRLHSSSLLGITFLDSKCEPQKGTTMEPVGHARIGFRVRSGFGFGE